LIGKPLLQTLIADSCHPPKHCLPANPARFGPNIRSLPKGRSAITVGVFVQRLTKILVTKPIPQTASVGKRRSVPPSFSPIRTLPEMSR